VTARQLETEACGVCAHPASDFEQTQAQRSEPQGRDARLAQPAPQQVEEPVGSGMQQETELVGPEAVTTEAVGKASTLEVVDLLFGGAALDIPVVEGQWGI
jgi:hypothetical protein